MSRSKLLENDQLKMSLRVGEDHLDLSGRSTASQTGQAVYTEMRGLDFMILIGVQTGDLMVLNMDRVFGFATSAMPVLPGEHGYTEETEN